MKNGFTLIELIVVIAIIAILALTTLASLNDKNDDENKDGYKMVCQNQDSKKIVDEAFCDNN